MSENEVSYLGLKFSMASGVAAFGNVRFDIQPPAPNKPNAPRRLASLFELLIKNKGTPITSAQLAEINGTTVTTARMLMRDLQKKIEDIVIHEGLKAGSLIVSHQLYNNEKTPVGLRLSLNKELLDALDAKSSLDGIATEPYRVALTDDTGQIIRESETFERLFLKPKSQTTSRRKAASKQGVSLGGGQLLPPSWERSNE